MAAKRPPMASPEEIADRAKERIEERVEAHSDPIPAAKERQKKAAAAPVQREEIVYDSTNERVVICAEIASREVRKKLVRSISPEELLVPEHSAMQRALRLMEEHGLDYDGQVFRRLIADEGVPVDEGYIASIEQGAGVPTNLEWHVETLRWDATRARVVRGSMPELVRVLKDPKASPDMLTNSIRALLRAVEGGAQGRRFARRPDELNRSYKADMAARKVAGNFYSFGYPAIDQMLIEGSMPKRTSMFVGMSGSGKSTFVSSLLVKLAELGRRVLCGCWEMGTESTLDLMVAQMCRLPIESVVQGTLTPDEMADVNAAIDWLTTNIKFMDNAFFNIEQGKGRADNNRSLDVLEGYIAESGCDVGAFDLWERCLVDLSYEGMTKALYRQQDMHARYNIHGMIVHQVRGKDVEGRPDKRPTRDSVKGTGAFVEVADLLFGFHREAMFKSGVPDDSIECICLKQRKGRAFWATRHDWDGSMGLITGGEEIPYNPGLESSREFGDVGDIKVQQTQRRKPSRRES